MAGSDATTETPTSPLGVRDWSLNVQIPGDHYEAVVQDCLSGFAQLEVRTERLNVLLCAQPKSASLYLTQLLASSLDLANHQIGFARSGGAVYYPRLLLAKFARTDTVSHCHAAPDADTLRLVRQLDFRLVVQFRNLLDALVSRRDMLLRDRWAGNFLHPAAAERFVRAPEREQLDLVIDAFAPQYLNFQAAWTHLCSAEGSPVIRSTFEELVEDEVALVGRIAAALGRRVDEPRIRAVSERIRAEGGINFSTGRVGRGRGAFDEAQIERLRTLAHRFGATDAALLGFEPAAGRGRTENRPSSHP